MECKGKVFEEIKDKIRLLVENQDKCGFSAYIISKSEAKLYEMILDDERHDENESFKRCVFNSLIETISDKYLSEGIEYAPSSQIADNQKKLYVVEQNEEYTPFDILNKLNSNITDFKASDIDDAKGFVYLFRVGETKIWAYQHLWSILVPNKKNNNILARMKKYEDYEYFTEQKEPLLTISKKIDLLIVENSIITSNVGLLQRSFGFVDFVISSANKTIGRVEEKGLLVNADKLVEYIQRGTSGKYAKKMMRIIDSPLFDVPNEILREKIHNLEGWKGKFDEDENGSIVLNTFAQVEHFIDFMDERYTRSDVTDQEYDTNVKQIAKPVNGEDAH